MTALTVQQESLADARITRDSNACMAEIYANSVTVCYDNCNILYNTVKVYV